MGQGSDGRAMATAPVDKPVHKHDCKQCKWVGSLAHPGSPSVLPCDVYVCQSEETTLLTIRYTKGIGNAVRHSVSRNSAIPEVVEGMLLARKKGMLPS